MVGLLYAVLDLNEMKEYSRSTIERQRTNCCKCGLSKRLVDEFLKPTLLVGLFKLSGRVERGGDDGIVVLLRVGASGFVRRAMD